MSRGDPLKKSTCHNTANPIINQLQITFPGMKSTKTHVDFTTDARVSSPAAISETRLPVILAGRVVELRCNGGRVLLLKPHKRRANPSQNVPLKDGKEMRGYYLMAASCRTTHAACRKGMRRPTSGVVRSPREHIKDKIVTLPTISVYNPLGRDKGS